MQKDLKSSKVLVLEKGAELHKSLIEFAKENQVKAAWVSGVGASSEVTIGYYDLETKEYVWQEFNEMLEILSLSGNCSVVDGEPFWHIHGVFSGKDFQAFGGHIKKLIVGITCELHIEFLEKPLTRKFDEEIGLKLLTEL